MQPNTVVSCCLSMVGGEIKIYYYYYYYLNENDQKIDMFTKTEKQFE